MSRHLAKAGISNALRPGPERSLAVPLTMTPCAHPRQCRLASAVRRRSSLVAAASAKKYDYDMFTIGAGSGGVRASRFASGNYGAKVGVCELPFDYVSSERSGGVGGTCVLRGCVPKKLMVYLSEFADEFRASVGFGWEERPPPALDWDRFMASKRKELMRLNAAYKSTLSNAKVDLVEGRGRLLDANTVDVDGKVFTARNILIATGARPTKLPIPGAELCITSDEVLELPRLPRKMLVVGSGYIGVEFAGIFARLGAEVHVVGRQALPLSALLDAETRGFAAEQYKAAGLRLHCNATLAAVKKQADGRLAATLRGKDGALTEEADNDVVLMATGRSPNTAGLGLEEAGVAVGSRGEVLVDEYSRSVSVPSVFAVGDVTNRVQLTPVALMEGMAVARTLFAGGAAPVKPDYWAVPSAIFSNPSVAFVGLSEEQAVAQLGDVDVFTTSFRPMKATLGGSPLRTFMKLVVDASSGRVVGAHMVGDHAGEIMQGFAVAVKTGVTKAELDSVVGIHPSSAEEFVTMRSATRKLRRSQQPQAQ